MIQNKTITKYKVSKDTKNGMALKSFFIFIMSILLSTTNAYCLDTPPPLPTNNKIIYNQDNLPQTKIENTQQSTTILPPLPGENIAKTPLPKPMNSEDLPILPENKEENDKADKTNSSPNQTTEIPTPKLKKDSKTSAQNSQTNNQSNDQSNDQGNNPNDQFIDLGDNKLSKITNQDTDLSIPSLNIPKIKKDNITQTINTPSTQTQKPTNNIATRDSSPNYKPGDKSTVKIASENTDKKINSSKKENDKSKNDKSSDALFDKALNNFLKQEPQKSFKTTTTKNKANKITKANKTKNKLELQEKQAFINEEIANLILPEDDVVLGKVTRQAYLQDIDFYQYINEFWANYVSAKEVARAVKVEQFLEEYYPE